MIALQFRDALIICFCGALYLLVRNRQNQKQRLPPRLPGWPIIGNSFQIPLSYAHKFYQELERKLGSNIMYLEALGQPIVIINDASVASDLLEKRSTIYSSRPPSQMLTEVIGAKHFFALHPYGEEWRNHRRMFQQHFSSRDLPREQETALKFVRKGLLPNLSLDPQQFHEHVHACVGGISLSMTYGLPVRKTNDPLIRKSANAFTISMGAAAPGKYLVNIFPVLKYVPRWFPGADFKRKAPGQLAQLLEMLHEPYERTMKDMDAGTAPECFVTSSLEGCRNKPDFKIHERYIKQGAAQIFGAAEGTTVIAIVTFILAMLQYPGIQRKVQQELDSVLGSDRLPDFSDRERLPYLTAVLKEVLRWNPIAPLGVPHMTTQDDTYNGYFIPKGTVVMANAHAMFQDEERFPNPKDFQPERFINNGVLLTSDLDPFVVATFGFGRRICPGAHIALAVFFIASASILSLFDISPELDSHGKPIRVTPEFGGASLVSEPLPFPCKITPRKGKNVEGLLQEYMGAETI